MKPCIERHPEYFDGCRLCWLAENDERYQKMWEIDGVKKLDRCVNLGGVKKIGGSSKEWRVCLAMAAPIVDGVSVVCHCRSKNSVSWRIGYECGPSCPKYETTSQIANDELLN